MPQLSWKKAEKQKSDKKINERTIFRLQKKTCLGRIRTNELIERNYKQFR